MTELELQEFIQAYIEAALFCTTDEDGEPLDKSFSIEDLPSETVTALTNDCRRFANDRTVAPWLAIAMDTTEYSAVQAGYDFWLTRNHHGAGFWDRSLGDIGERLATAASAYGERTLYVGDDGKVYVC